MTTGTIAFYVIGVTVAVFATAATILAILERIPGLGAGAAVGFIPSRATAVFQIVGGAALGTFALVLDEPLRPAMLATALGMLMGAASAFVAAEPRRARLALMGYVLLGIGAMTGSLILGLHKAPA
jgi:hypothetical protein